MIKKQYKLNIKIALVFFFFFSLKTLRKIKINNIPFFPYVSICNLMISILLNNLMN